MTEEQITNVQNALVLHRTMALNAKLTSPNSEAVYNQAMKILDNEFNSWQPIETAPKDGTNILVFAIHPYEDSYITVCAYCQNYKVFMYNGMTVGHAYLTHWMPLPEPPKED